MVGSERMLRILGVQAGIDSSVCLLVDGVITHALQEERFNGIKNYVGMPKQAIAKILEMAGLDINQIDAVALPTVYNLVSPGIEGHNAIAWKVRQLVKWKLKPVYILWDDIVPVIKERAPDLFVRLTQFQREKRIAWFRAQTGYLGPVFVVDHHLAHAASAYYSAQWKDEPMLVLSKDGSGDGLCATVSVGENGTLRRVATTRHNESLGYLYTAVTYWMGMKAHEHEGKVTGLAPWAKPEHGDPVYEQFKELLDLDETGLRFKRKVFEPLCNPFIKPHIDRIFEHQRFDNIAYGIQKLTEELMVRWTRNAIEATGVRKVVGGGGLFLNVKVNKLIREMPEVESFFPMTTPGDGTTSFGAAYVVYAQMRKEQGSEINIAPLGDLYLGDPLDEKLTDLELDLAQSPEWEVTAHTRNVDDLAADLIMKGEVIARVRGRMEFGARALGNRSILCDASNLRNVGIINSAIKSRDFWMPFAPVILDEFADVYLKRPAPAPWMTMAFDTTQAAQEDLIAAIHQADKTARPQILNYGVNDGYYDILTSMLLERDIGGLLNTSYNLHGFPLVRDAKQAMHVFKSSSLKHMVIGDYLVSKKVNK